MVKKVAVLLGLFAVLWVLAFVGCAVNKTEEEAGFLIEAALKSKIRYSDRHTAIYPDRLKLDSPTKEVYFGVENPFYEYVSVLLLPICEDTEGKREEMIGKQFINVGPRKMQIVKLLVKHPGRENHFFCTITAQIKDIQEKPLLVVETNA